MAQVFLNTVIYTIFGVIVFGLAFWAMMLFAAVVGLCRGVKRLYDSAMDVFRGRRFKPAE